MVMKDPKVLIEVLEKDREILRAMKKNKHLAMITILHYVLVGKLEVPREIRDKFI